VKSRITIAVVLLVAIPLPVFGDDAAICLNSLGFLPDMPKKASIASSCSEFAVKNAATGAVVHSGAATGPTHQDDVDQDVWIADFSGVSVAGKYYLDVPGVGRSIDFEVGDGVYDAAFYTAMRAFYLWRCGTAVEGTHDGKTYAHAACHMEDGWLDHVGSPGVRRDGAGGWHDAGDHGKYVVNAGVTVGSLFLAWDHFQDRLKDVSLDLPDTAPGYPDFLKELKWEIDWLLKMAYADGTGKVSHKLTRLRFSGMIMPEKDQEKRYFTQWSSAATADFVAMMAMAARYFKPYDSEYAQTCLDAAENGYKLLASHPQEQRFRQGDFRTGGYQTGDADDRLWAAAEMWETTGQLRHLKDLETRAKAPRRGRRGRSAPTGMIDENWDWGNVRNLGMFTYVLSERAGRDPNLLETVRRDLAATADSIVAQAKRDVYGRPLGGRYYWGCNGTVARQVLTLQIANKASARADYVDAALDAVGHLFGRNYYGRSFVTGLGHMPPMNPHDRRSAADGIEAPWPGYVVGGGHSATDWKDLEEDYRTNEIAINWQAALVYALAGFTQGGSESAAVVTRKPDVVFVPTPQEVVNKMLEMAEIKEGDLLYDLGCGDGRIVVTAARKYGIKAVGFDIDPVRVEESLENVRKNKVEHLVTIKQADVFTLDLREANVVTLYLLPSLNVRLMPQLEQLRPGSRILSHEFDMNGAKPLEVARVMPGQEGSGGDEWGEYEAYDGEYEHTIYKWVVPWEKTEDAPAS